MLLHPIGRLVAAGLLGAALYGAAPGVAAQPRAAAPTAPVAPQPDQVGDPLIRWLLDVIQDSEMLARREPVPDFVGQIAQVVRAHPQFRSQDETADAARRAIDEAWAGYLPTISGSSDGGYRRVGPNVNGSRGFTSNGVGVGVQVRQTVYDFGATSGVVGAAQLRLEAAQARREALEGDLAARAVVAHLDVLRFRTLLGFAERNVADRRVIVALMERREELGGSGSPEVRRATARLAAARSAQIAIENRLRTAEAAYREVFGRHPETLRLPEDLSVPASIDSVVAGAIDRHPSVREAKANAGAARLEADVARYRALPNVGIEGGVVRRNQIGDDLPGTDASLLLVFRHNIYTGGADTARIAQAAARSRKAEFDQRTAERDLERSVRQVAAEAENGDRTIDARIQSVLAGIDALRANREQLEVNRGSFTELLKVQEELFDAGRELIDSVFDRTLARYRLAQLTGDLSEMIGSAWSEAGGMR